MNLDDFLEYTFYIYINIFGTCPTTRPLYIMLTAYWSFLSSLSISQGKVSPMKDYIKEDQGQREKEGWSDEGGSDESDVDIE